MIKTDTGIYIHIPFCQRKCKYCDFLSGEANDEIKEKYINSLLNQIIYEAKKYRINRRIRTIYIGGGTPSIIYDIYIKKIIETINEWFEVIENVEITLEVNPGTVNFDKFKEYKNAGINRVSMGLQSADNMELKILGRIHTYEEFEDNYMAARRAGINNINIDLMSAIPNQTYDSYVKSLNKIISLKPEHISSYSLIIEEGTYFYKHQNELQLVDENTERKMYHITNNILKEHGYNRYEISNYSRIGYESKHNSSYWTGIEYIGFGLGASSYIKYVDDIDEGSLENNNLNIKNKDEKKTYMVRYKNITDINVYIEMYKDINNIEEAAKNEKYLGCTDIKHKNIGHTDIEYIDKRGQMEEFMYLGLRMIKGIDTYEFRKKFNCDVNNVYGKVINKYINSGHLIYNNSSIRLSEKGIDVSNVIFSDFLIEY